MTTTHYSGHSYPTNLILLSDTAPPKEILRSGRLTFAEAGFVPAVLVHMAIDDAWKKEPLLSQDCLKQFHKSHQEAELLASRGR